MAFICLNIQQMATFLGKLPTMTRLDINGSGQSRFDRYYYAMGVHFVVYFYDFDTGKG
jgi:hypothetical protein